MQQIEATGGRGEFRGPGSIPIKVFSGDQVSVSIPLPDPVSKSYCEDLKFNSGFDTCESDGFYNIPITGVPSCGSGNSGG